MKDLDRLLYRLKMLNIAEQIIAICIALFIIQTLTGWVTSYSFLDLSHDFGLNTNIWLSPWKLFTYAWFHTDLFALIWNMFILFYSSQIFLNLYKKDTFINLYVVGIVYNALLFSVIVFFIKDFRPIPSITTASPPVLTLLFFCATVAPNYPIRFFTFNLKFRQFALLIGGYFLLQLYSSNSLFYLPHFCAMGLGYFYAKQFYKGRDIGSWVTVLRHSFKKSKSSHKKTPFKHVYKNKSPIKTTPEKSHKHDTQKKVDVILDKISKSGYESLSKEEKDFLFKSHKNL